MRYRRLLLATLAVTFLASIAVAQTVRERSLDAIRRGNDKYAKAEYQLAIEEYRRVQPSSDETYAKALYNIGVCHYELWNTDEALVYYRKAIAARPRYPMALHALGVALKDLKRLSEARGAFTESIVASSGGHAPAHYMLGMLAMSEGDHKAAAAFFKEAISRSRDRFPASHNNLGVALARMGRLREAQREFETALRYADGEFDVAIHNLNLCRFLLASSAKAQLASLKTVETTESVSK
ncbi:MAG: tetratricopeptide repeat protein [Pyrinomonadaceae bacterium]